jgi:hypothetical protein
VLGAEGNDVGVTWANMGDVRISSLDGVTVPISFATVMGMLAVDFVAYMLLNQYLERVVPNEYGTTLPWHFPLHASWWKDGSLGGGLCGPPPPPADVTAEPLLDGSGGCSGGAGGGAGGGAVLEAVRPGEVRPLAVRILLTAL